MKFDKTFCLSICITFVNKLINFQTSVDLKQSLEGANFNNLTPKDVAYLEFVAAHKQHIIDKLDEKFEDLKDYLEPMKV